MFSLNCGIPLVLLDSDWIGFSTLCVGFVTGIGVLVTFTGFCVVDGAFASVVLLLSTQHFMLADGHCMSSKTS